MPCIDRINLAEYLRQVNDFITSWWFIETLDWRTWKVQSYTLIRHGFIHKLLPIPYSFSSYDITISSTFQCITGETNGGRQRNVLNREREYGTMRYRRGMITGDFKERGCREDSCIILFAPLFVPLSKLARANAICKSQKCDRWPSPMKNPKTKLWSQISTVSSSLLFIGTHTSDARKVLILVQFSISV